MLNILIPEMSPTAGENSDGVVLGSVAESLLTGAFETRIHCPNVIVYRMDRTNSSLNILDDSTAAQSTTPSSWTPFGSGAAFTTGDEFLVTCSSDIQAILFRVDVAAIHSGTLHVYDSEDGVWATNELTVTDTSNAFRNTGWHYITLPDNAQRVTWKPSNDPSLNPPSRKYYRFRLDGIVGGNTAPQCSELVLVGKVFPYEDHTTNANGATNTAPPADFHYPWPETQWRWCFANPAYGAEVYMHLAGTNVITDTHEYLASDDTWKPLSGWTNASNDFTNGPTILGDPVQKFAIRWSIPTDWVSKSQTITLFDNTTVTHTGYWIRERTLTVTQYGTHQNPRYRIRARQYGNANTTGVEMRQSMSILGISILNATTPNTTNSVCQIANMTTGQASSFTIPANPVFPVNVDTVDIAFTAGQRFGIVCSSGGTLQNAQIALQ